MDGFGCRHGVSWPVAIRWLLVAAGIGVGACAAAVFGGRFAAGIDGDHARSEVARGIALGTIPDSDTPEPYGRRGPHPFNECLIYMMAASKSGAPWRDAIAPPAPAPIVASAEAVPGGVCGPLADWAQTGRMEIPLAPYGRYLQGHRLLAAAALALDAVAYVPLVLSTACYCLLALSLLRIGIALASGAWRQGDGRTRLLGLGVVSACFLLFYALPGFSRTLSHAPADLGLFTLLCLACGRDLLERSGMALAVIFGAFGAWAAVFEFLSGPLPMLVALVAVIHGLSTSVSGPTRLACASLAVAIALAAFATTFLAKQCALWLVEPAVAVHSVDALLRWIRGTRQSTVQVLPSWRELFDMLRWQLPDLYMLPTGAAYALAGLSLLSTAAGVLLLRTSRAVEVSKVVLLAAPLLVAAAWYAVLPKHTVVHVNFMVRLLVWVPASGGIFLLLLSVAPRRRGENGPVR